MEAEMADLRAQLTTLQSERDHADANAARLAQQLERLAVSDDARRVPPPLDPYDCEHDAKYRRHSHRLTQFLRFG